MERAQDVVQFLKCWLCFTILDRVNRRPWLHAAHLEYPVRVSGIHGLPYRVAGFPIRSSCILRLKVGQVISGARTEVWTVSGVIARAGFDASGWGAWY